MNLRSANLPRISTYAMALEHYEKSVPFRSGRERGKRPLGNRRYTYCQIDKVEETGAIILVMYGSNVVTIMPDGEFRISLCNYDTIGTRQFIYATTPFPATHCKGTTYLQVGDKSYAFDTPTHTLFVLNGEVFGAIAQYNYRMNNKAMIEVRKKYADFREYVRLMGNVMPIITDVEVLDALSSGKIPSKEGANGRTQILRLFLPTAHNRYYHGSIKPIEHIVEFLIQVRDAQERQDLEKYRYLFLQLGASSLRYNAFMHGYAAGWTSGETDTIGAPMLKFFDEMLKHRYRGQIFTKVEVPVGEKCNNTNHQYF